MPPAITAIVPVYQAEATLEATLRSVADQQFRDWECLVVNDGSTDASPRIAEEYAKADSRFQVIHQKNAGVSAARNAGIARATASFLHFLDADDLVLPKAYQGFVANLALDPAAAVCYCADYYMIDAAGMELGVYSTTPAVNYCSLLEHNFGPPVCAVVRKSVIDKVSGFEPSLSGLADWDFWLRIARAGGRFVRIAGTLVRYRYVPGSMSQNARAMYRDAVRIHQFLAEPDGRIRGECISAISADLLDRWVASARSFSLGCAVLARDAAFTRELLGEIKSGDTSRGQELFRADVFAWGVKHASGCFHALPSADLARILRDIYEGVRQVEGELDHDHLLEAVLETLLVPYREAVRERDQLRASTSYKLGRLVTRCKFW